MKNKSIFGWNENIVAALSYVFSPVTAFVVLVLEKENKFVRFHAMQSFIVFLALAVVGFISGIIPLLNLFIPQILTVVYWVAVIFLAFNAYSGKEFKIPMIGDICNKQVYK